ncbi:uncharacterized protein BDZ99DRAFT_169355 [Mytilinidion resinicola]|uniref:Uncharacterized protein n=1 Tax=Mytilinidion resinicola TaxID=574789 RepID=A0A6A6Y5D1_9PEZI|nr:uncharacterized protein BDZ99DRAFT_169355 [Mytilinidion resinicola]KAF2803234.1 hypothetical protein BDZ99DRAFT_169355 [Mytilinidion resinicola]
MCHIDAILHIPCAHLIDTLAPGHPCDPKKPLTTPCAVAKEQDTACRVTSTKISWKSLQRCERYYYYDVVGPPISKTTPFHSLPSNHPSAPHPSVSLPPQTHLLAFATLFHPRERYKQQHTSLSTPPPNKPYPLSSGFSLPRPSIPRIAPPI